MSAHTTARRRWRRGFWIVAIAGGTILLLVPVFFVMLGLWLAIAEDEGAQRGPFRLGGERLIGHTSFDSVERCPLRFPELDALERCLGEDHSFQDKSWWVFAEGPRSAIRVRGDRVNCKRFGLDEAAGECRLEVLSDTLEQRHQRLFIGGRRDAGARAAAVLETMNFDPRRALKRARGESSEGA